LHVECRCPFNLPFWAGSFPNAPEAFFSPGALAQFLKSAPSDLKMHSTSMVAHCLPKRLSQRLSAKVPRPMGSSGEWSSFQMAFRQELGHADGRDSGPEMRRNAHRAEANDRFEAAHLFML
jgi:hypothetical protein